MSEPPNTISAPNTPTPSPATDVGIKDSPVKPEYQEGAEDAGEVKKKRKRRRRRKGDTKDATTKDGEEPENENEDGEVGGDGAAVAPGGVPSTQVLPASSSLVISDAVLGILLSITSNRLLLIKIRLRFAWHGRLHGFLAGRAVAVKRLQSFCYPRSPRSQPSQGCRRPSECHPVLLLRGAYNIPLHRSRVERPDQFREIAVSFNPKRAISQITFGLRHEHALKIVHHDIKPQNILISGEKKGESSGHRMLISDFGLCRKLELDQTSFLPTTGGATGVGTFGWRAPEILQGEVKLDETIAGDNSQGSHDSVGTATGSNHSGMGRPTTRLTKSVGIFVLGCLYYYSLTNGGHPFNDRFEREVNILPDQKSLHGLEGFVEEGLEAVDLINSMLAPEAADRFVYSPHFSFLVRFLMSV